MSEPSPTSALFCANHPSRETSLRCNRCEKPICPECAVLTPTGYRCKECVRGIQKTFDTARSIDYPIAFILAAVLAGVGSITTVVGFFTILVAPIIGVLIAEAVRFAIRRRRARSLFITAAAGAALGAVIPLLLSLVFGGFSLFSFIWQAVYLFFVTSTVYSRLGGIFIR